MGQRPEAGTGHRCCRRRRLSRSRHCRRRRRRRCHRCCRRHCRRRRRRHRRRRLQKVLKPGHRLERIAMERRAGDDQ